MSLQVKRISLIGGLFILGVGIWLGINQFQKASIPIQKVTIADANSFLGSPVYIALSEGYFKEENLEVTLQKHPHGGANLNAVWEGKSDMGTSSETPFIRAVLGKKNLSVFATMVNADNHLAVVVRKDRGIEAATDLVGKTIGVTTGSNGEYFLDIVLRLHKIQRDQIQAVNVRPNQMFDAITSGKVDAIATWNPNAYRAQKELGGQATTFNASGVYSPFFIIVAKKDYIQANPEVIQRVIRALLKATNFIQENPKKTLEIVSQQIKMDKSLLEALSSIYRFKVSLDQSFIQTLSDQSEWVIQHGLTDETTSPNYFENIYMGALEAIKPEAVTIIR